jgi:ATP-binding cassette, subfamily F, member 3
MITLKNLVLRRGTKVLLDGASTTINPGEKVGLVGRNGAGKSSLFRLLDKTLHEDKGDFYDAPAVAHGAGGAGHARDRHAPPVRDRRRHVTLLAAQQEVRRPRRATTASAWPTPTWRCTTPAPTTHRPARRR